ncbi:MAG: DUF2294 domain-containing protein [Solirubrobacteraceae bacterium]
MFEQNADPDMHRQGEGAEQTTTPALEIANAMARLHKQFIGRGPTNTRVTIDTDMVVCLLEGGYTKAEQTLEENNKGDLVAAGRLGLQEAMRNALIASVETTLGRRVRSFMSANDLPQNLQVEVFVLHRRDSTSETLLGE